ncbi:hypothetical protein [Cellulomonas telluris]|uniref:hypothetical protein n=1 Tax=Cellulomonas telluris TaxID=2306636 RepID=UPI0010A7F5BC|nr:hypothetical protein [Cellulomonas telluris]
MTHASEEHGSLADALRMDGPDVEFDPGRVSTPVRDAELDDMDAQQRAALDALAGMDHAADLLDPQVRAAARGDTA